MDPGPLYDPSAGAKMKKFLIILAMGIALAMLISMTVDILKTVKTASEQRQEHIMLESQNVKVPLEYIEQIMKECAWGYPLDAKFRHVCHLRLLG